MRTLARPPGQPRGHRGRNPNVPLSSPLMGLSSLLSRSPLPRVARAIRDHRIDLRNRAKSARFQHAENARSVPYIENARAHAGVRAHARATEGT